MNSKRSIWSLILAGAAFGLLVTNCTIKSDSDKDTGDDDGACTKGSVKNGCTDCPGNVTGHQDCLSSGVYGSCICPVNSGGDAGSPSSPRGGSGNVAGYGGYGGSSGHSESEAGSGGEAGVDGVHLDPTDCSACLVQLCAPEFDACAAEDENHPPDPQDPTAYCLSSDGTQPGQLEKIIDCITAVRATGKVANREAVRACGASLGESSNPADNPAFTSWPPPSMTPATEELINCMADLPTQVDNPGAWATDSSNFPDGAPPKPWDNGTCAKFSCTSAE